LEQAFCNARVVTRDEDFIGSVLVRDGAIAAVNRGPGRVGEDFDGDILMPGVIDIHTDNLERHFFPRPNIGWNPVSASVTHDAACVSVGVTTVFDSMSVGSLADTTARAQDNLSRLVEGLHAARESAMLKADHHIHWRCETTADELVERLPPLVEHPMTAMLSMMDHTPGQRQYRNIEAHLRGWRERGMSEDDVARRLEEIRGRQARNAASNARFVASVAKARNLALASHDDEDVEHIDQGADLGATIAEFPVTREAAERAVARRGRGHGHGRHRRGPGGQGRGGRGKPRRSRAGQAHPGSSCGAGRLGGGRTRRLKPFSRRAIKRGPLWLGAALSACAKQRPARRRGARRWGNRPARPGGASRSETHIALEAEGTRVVEDALDPFCDAVSADVEVLLVEQVADPEREGQRGVRRSNLDAAERDPAVEH
jgi:phosphonate metabolism protein PhnM